jgi:hypothetical protein
MVMVEDTWNFEKETMEGTWSSWKVMVEDMATIRSPYLG